MLSYYHIVVNYQRNLYYHFDQYFIPFYHFLKIDLANFLSFFAINSNVNNLSLSFSPGMGLSQS